LKALRTVGIIAILAITSISFKEGEARVNNCNELKVLSDSTIEQSTKPKYRVLIAEGSFSKNDQKIYCSYSSSKPNTNTDLQICLRSLTEMYDISILQNECNYIIKSENSIGLYGKACTNLSFLSDRLLLTPEKEDSINNEELFDHFYYELFVHVNQYVDVVMVKPLTHDLIGEGSSGPEKHEKRLLKKQFDQMRSIDSKKVDSASFRVDKEDVMRDYLYQHFLFNNRVATITFNGKAQKVVIYEVER
jgi:hypothetical protein